MAIELIGKIKQKNNGSFALVDSQDIDHEGKRLNVVLQELNDVGTGVTALTQRVEANEGNITALQGEVAKKVEIDDAQASATKTYSSQKVDSQITAAKQAVKDDLLGGAGEAYDTLKELADALVTNKDAITALQQIAQGHVQFDKAQSLNDEQKKQARANIEAGSCEHRRFECRCRKVWHRSRHADGRGLLRRDWCDRPARRLHG